MSNCEQKEPVAGATQVREIQGYLAEMYGTEVLPDFISKVTDGATA